MTDLRADGLYECDSCGSTYDAEKSLVFCCNPAYDKPSFERGYD